MQINLVGKKKSYLGVGKLLFSHFLQRGHEDSFLELGRSCSPDREEFMRKNECNKDELTFPRVGNMKPSQVKTRRMKRVSVMY